MQLIYKYFVTKSLQLQMVLKFQTCFHSLGLYDLLQQELVGLKKDILSSICQHEKGPFTESWYKWGSNILDLDPITRDFKSRQRPPISH